jgi:FtsP/CotA-like multicopper oxidase with cupredoxin domain
MKMSKTGYAKYIENSNELEVIRPGENSTRRIRCANLNPNRDHVQGIEVHGDEIWILTNSNNNNRPNRKFVYKFSSLSGGGSSGY